jgi:hypothetical protein
MVSFESWPFLPKRKSSRLPLNRRLSVRCVLADFAEFEIGVEEL